MNSVCVLANDKSLLAGAMRCSNAFTYLRSRLVSGMSFPFIAAGGGVFTPSR